MNITIIIPTCNRREQLRRTLQDFREHSADELQRELIIARDGSTDSTQDRVMEFKRRLPVRYLRQPKCTVSSARNLGLQEASSADCWR